MLDESTKGIFTITATPFLPDGALDFHSLEQMVNVYIEKGLHNGSEYRSCRIGSRRNVRCAGFTRQGS